MDSVLLSDFAKEIKGKSKVVDLGTGTGIIPILLSAKTEAEKIVGIEIQEKMVELAKRNVELNNLNNKIEIINEDIKNIKNNMEKEIFDVVITNPPYKKDNTGLKNIHEGKLIARHEIKCNLEDIILASKFLLKNNGELFMVHRPERLVDIIFLLRKYKIEPKVIKFIFPKANKEPNLVLIKGIKNAKPFLKIEKPLYIYKEDGTYSDEVLKIYNKKGEENEG